MPIRHGVFVLGMDRAGRTPGVSVRPRGTTVRRGPPARPIEEENGVAEAWIIDAVRSPRGGGKAGKGGLADVHPQRVLAQVLQELERRNGLETADVDDVIMGCAAGSGDHAMDIARMAVLDAGWSLDAPGVTLNRFCGSGQQAVNFAAMGVLAGHQDLVVGGGVESMSRDRTDACRRFQRQQPRTFRRSSRWCPQGISADLIAILTGFHPRGVRRTGAREPAAGRHRHRGGTVREEHRADLPRRRATGVGSRRAPETRHDA